MSEKKTFPNAPGDKEEKPQPWMDTIGYEFSSAKKKYEIYESTIRQLKTDEKAQEYFAQFNGETLDSSIRQYAWRKAEWMVTRERSEYWMGVASIRIQTEAEVCLGNIQQRKLFDKQCLWRAEQFTHPAVETYFDFYYWEHNVLNCPFLEPVTEDEVELYIEYLQTYTGENLAFLGGWQDYDTYNSNKLTVLKAMNPVQKDTEDEKTDAGFGEETEDVEEDENAARLMPPWYIFYDERKGTGVNLLLPDKRKEKDIFYWKAGHDEEADKIREQWKQNPPDRRPFFSCYGLEKTKAFISRFEKDPEVMKAYLVWEKYHNDPEENKAMYWVKDAWYHLRDCYESFPITGNTTDWKEALIATAKAWKNTKLIRALPIAYQEYLMRIECGIEHPFDRKREADQRNTLVVNKERILRGRELKGEPRDFHY